MKLNSKDCRLHILFFFFCDSEWIQIFRNDALRFFNMQRSSDALE